MVITIGANYLLIDSEDLQGSVHMFTELMSCVLSHTHSVFWVYLPQQFTGGVVGGASPLTSPTTFILHIQVHLIPFVQRRRQADCNHDNNMRSRDQSSTTEPS